MKNICVICVGKIKTICWKEAFNHYLKQASRWRSIECIEVRDGNEDMRLIQEKNNILAKICPSDDLIGLHETGKCMNSREFASWLQHHDETNPRRAVFIVGGPYGLDNALKDQCSLLLSLSPMTFPHELARVLLMEQIFRAESIIHKLPYHH